MKKTKSYVLLPALFLAIIAIQEIRKTTKENPDLDAKGILQENIWIILIFIVASVLLYFLNIRLSKKRRFDKDNFIN